MKQTKRYICNQCGKKHLVGTHPHNGEYIKKNRSCWFERLLGLDAGNL
jgi:hypothetical protein